jgi:hypothetical protein
MVFAATCVVVTESGSMMVDPDMRRAIMLLKMAYVPEVDVAET